MIKLNKHILALIIFNAVYIIGFLIYYLTIGNFEFLWYLLVLTIISLVILFTLKKTKIDYLVLWLLSIWGLVHMVAGGFYINGHTLYATHLIPIIDKGGDYFIFKMDQLVHMYGVFTAALLIYSLTKRYFVGKSGKFLPAFIAWIGSMGLGALNEVVEFIAFLSLSKTGVGDLYNTGFDLIFNLLGAFIGALVATRLYNKNQTKKA